MDYCWVDDGFLAHLVVCRHIPVGQHVWDIEELTNAVQATARRRFCSRLDVSGALCLTAGVGARDYDQVSEQALFPRDDDSGFHRAALPPPQ